MKPKNRVFPTTTISRLLMCLIIVSSLLSLSQSVIGAPATQGSNSQDGPEVISRGISTAVKFDTSPPLRSIPPAEIDPNQVFEDFDPPSGLEGPLGPQSVDPSVQTTVGAPRMPAPIISFDAFDNQSSATPPDPVGDVGPNHYVAMSNVHFAVFDKAGNLLYGPVPNNTLWSGFGGACEYENAGDPIVVYDQLADRWMLTQFSDSNPPWYNCVALSVSGDPTGAYYRWAFETPTGFPDYPKYGVWPDAYYISTREFNGGFVGVGAYALNRDQMLAGNPTPQVVSFLLPPGSQPYNVGDGLLPSDLDGSTLPPAGSPNYYMGSMDDGAQYGAPQDALTLWEFHVDWVTPGNSTFTLVHTIPTDAFDSIYPCSPGSRDCIPQPDTSEKIDILSYRQRPMWRLAYRNFGTHEALVTNQSVEAATEMAGIRWYEVRDPNGSPYIYQQGTYAPGASDGIHRWMGSIAMDRDGNMALGYSASNSTTTYPSIWYTGRLASDPLGTMPQGEGVIVNGSGSQLSTGSRWGDYTSMNVDPVDDCTFWYINEYYPVTHNTEWYLRIGAFRFPSCDTVGADLSIVKTDAPDPVAPGGTLTYTLDINNAGPSNIPYMVVNSNQITINVSGPATPYPSTIDVSEVSGPLVKATVTLHDVNHAWPDDIDIILVGPSGQNTYLMSDAGYSYNLVDVTLTFDDNAAGPLPDSSQIVAGTYQPTNYDVADAFPAPAPPGPYPTSLAVFNGTDPNGTWSLYVVDDTDGNSGYIANGWSLALYTGDVVTVTDNLPAGVGLSSYSAPGWTCNQAGQQFICTTDTLPVGSTQIGITATVPAATGYITNTAGITSTLFDYNPFNNSDQAATLVDTAPQAEDDSYSTPEDTPLIEAAPGVMTNDNDPDGDPLVATLTVSPTNGTLILDPDGAFTYTPDLNYNGSDGFSYMISDGYLTATAAVTIDVTPVDDAPLAEDDAYTTTEDIPLVVAAPGVLGNDSDPDGDPLTATLLTGSLHGEVVLNLDGSFTYTPDLNYNGADAFTYTLSDGALTDTAAVDLTIDPVNDNPIVDAGEDQQGNEGAILTFTGSFTDPGLLAQPLAGESIHWDFGDGSTMTGTLTPTHAYADEGVYTVTLTVTDSLGAVGMDTLAVTVSNVAPELAPLPDLNVDPGEALTLTVSFTDPGWLDAHLVTIAWGDGVTETHNLTAGVLELSTTYTYTAVGVYTATVTVEDEDGGQDSLTFTVTVHSFQHYLPIIYKN